VSGGAVGADAVKSYPPEINRRRGRPLHGFAFERPRRIGRHALGLSPHLTAFYLLRSMQNPNLKCNKVATDGVLEIMVRL